MKRIWLQRRRLFKKVHVLRHAQLTPVRNNNFLFLKEIVTCSTYAPGALRSSTTGMDRYTIKSKIFWHVQKKILSLLNSPSKCGSRVFQKVEKTSFFIWYDVLSNFHA
jgi:hypothetical protein